MTSLPTSQKFSKLGNVRSNIAFIFSIVAVSAAFWG